MPSGVYARQELLQQEETYDEGEEASTGYVTTGLLKAAIAIDHAAEAIAAEHDLSEEMADQVKMRLAGILVAVCLLAIFACICALYLGLRRLRRRAAGYQKALVNDALHSSDDDDDEQLDPNTVSGKVNILLEARLKGEIVDDSADEPRWGTIAHPNDQILPGESSMEYAARMQQQGRPDSPDGSGKRKAKPKPAKKPEIMHGALPWGRVQLSTDGDHLPPKAVRPDEALLAAVENDAVSDRDYALLLAERERESSARQSEIRRISVGMATKVRQPPLGASRVFTILRHT